MERLKFDRLYRWFVGLGIDDAVWDLGRHSLAIQHAVAGCGNRPAERSRHRASAHRVEAILRHEGRERAPDTAEE
jgi:hypothetical protein